jgi:RNA polymerase sigma factor (sigma-70 family)
MQMRTNYTTYDLAYYYADLARLPRPSREERQQLVTACRQMTNLDPQTRNRLVEHYLRLATHIAVDRCPPSHYQSLPDILGEVALTLVKVTDRYHFQAGNDFTAYVIACTDVTIKRTVATDRLVKVPDGSLWRARQNGTEKALYNLQPESLDEWMEWYETDEREEPPTAPILPTGEAPPRDPVLRAQVQEWLSYLPPRQQAVLTLRYGLSDEDEYCFTPAETARVLKMKPRAVYYAEREAKERIRALVEGTATIVERNGRQEARANRPRQKPPVPTPEQEAILMQAATRMCEQGITVSSRKLAEATGKNVNLVLVFLRAHRHELPLVASAKTDTREARLARVAQVYAEFVAKGEHGVGIRRLAKAAHIDKRLVAKFLHTQRGTNHATA